jgi:hypothetical protein
VRAYLMIQSDFERLCEYVEPSPESLATYSYRIHELLMRSCIEVEANLKAIIRENTSAQKRFNMGLYRKIDVTHHLSSYRLLLSIWNGQRRIIRPFASWFGPNGYGTGHNPAWYKAFNESKHDRHEACRGANLEQLIDAIAGLLVVISSQFRTEDFSAAFDVLSIGVDSLHDFGPAIGSLFRIEFPEDWPDEERYDFDWGTLRHEPVRFCKIDYDRIAV